MCPDKEMCVKMHPQIIRLKMSPLYINDKRYVYPDEDKN